MVTSNQQNTPKYLLEVIPDTLYGNVYTNYAFRARLNGMAMSDVRFKWDFGDGYNPNYPDYYSNHEYNKAGAYTITVKAYDNFRDTLLATTIVPAYISSIEYSVDLIPNSTDTGLLMNSDGTFKEMVFSVSTSLPLSKAVAYWSFSDGSPDTTTFPYYNSSLNHVFTSAGVHKVKVRIEDHYGNIIGADSSSITVHHEPFDISTLAKAKRVSVTLSLDTVPAAFKAQGYQNPVNFGMNLVNDAKTTTSWSGNSFSGHYKYIDDFGSLSYTIADYMLSGTISNDLKKIEQISLAIYDSTVTNTTVKAIDMGFSLRDLDFHAITEKEIIYKIVAPPLTNIAPDLRYRSVSLYSGPCTEPDPLIIHYVVGNEKKYPYAYVIFTRK